MRIIIIIIIQIFFIQQSFFAANANTFNRASDVKQMVAIGTPVSVADSTQKATEMNRLQAIGKFPVIYPTRQAIKTMVEPEITGFYETACAVTVLKNYDIN